MSYALVEDVPASWEQYGAWLRFSADHEAALGSVDPVVTARTVVRDLRAIHVVVGDLGKGFALPDRIAVRPGNDSDRQESAATGLVMGPAKGEV